VAINVRTTTTEILMGVTVVEPGTTTTVDAPSSGAITFRASSVTPGAVASTTGVQAYPTWQIIRATGQSGYDPSCPFYFETASVADAVRLSLLTPFVEVASATDAVTSLLTYIRTASDAASATDNLTALITYIRAITDPVTATDAPTFGFSTVYGDSAAATDSVVYGFNRFQSPSDPTTATDATAFDLTRPVGDPTTATDATAFSLTRPVGDPATATDVANTALTMPRTAADSATVSDSLQIVWQAANKYGETANASPLNSAAINSSTAWVEQWTYNY